MSVDRARKDAAAEWWACPGCGRLGTSMNDLLRQGCEGAPERLVLVSELEAAQKERDELAATLALADGLYLLHKVEHDDDPESPADTTGFCAANCKACIFNVARGKEDRRDPTKVAATPTPTKENA